MYGARLVNTTKVVDDGVPLETTLRVYGFQTTYPRDHILETMK